jgi:hypothetical protein
VPPTCARERERERVDAVSGKKRNDKKDQQRNEHKRRQKKKVIDEIVYALQSRLAVLLDLLLALGAAHEAVVDDSSYLRGVDVSGERGSNVKSDSCVLQRTNDNEQVILVSQRRGVIALHRLRCVRK